MGDRAGNWILNQLSVLQAGSWVLEVGCGSCDLTRRLAANFPLRVVGSDIYAWGMRPATLHAVRERKGKSFFVAADVLNLGFKNVAFQAIFSVVSFHHAADPQKACLEMGRVLGKGGMLLVADWIYGAKTGVPERYYRPDEMEAFLKQAFFKNVFIEILDDQMLVRAQKF